MPELEEKFKISPEREAKNQRLKPLRETLKNLSEKFSLLEIYTEVSDMVNDSCTEGIYWADTVEEIEMCIDYANNIAQKLFRTDDLYKKICEAKIREGIAIEGISFLAEVVLNIIITAKIDHGYRELSYWLCGTVEDRRAVRKNTCIRNANILPSGLR